MTASASISVSGPEDILGYIPHSLGYWPGDSLVAITLQENRIGATLRVDLPGSTRPSDLMQYAVAVRQYLETDRKADGVVLAVFSAKAWEDLPAEYGQLLAAMGQELAGEGLGVRDAWYVGDRYWRDALCRDTACCPWPGRSLEEIRDSRLNAELVYRGSSVGTAPVLPSASASPSRHLPDPAGDDWFGRLSGRSTSRTQFVRVLDAWEHALLKATPGYLDPEQMAYLRAVLRVPAWRDAVLVMCAAGRAVALDGAERFGIFDAAPDDPALSVSLPGMATSPGHSGCRDADAGSSALRAAGANTAISSPTGHEGSAIPGYGEVLLGLAPAKPDWKSLDALDRVLQRVVEEGGGAAGAAALTGRGWIAWCRGRGSYAAAFLRQALEFVPEYRLAELLHEMVGRGTLCGWAGNPQSAWQKFGADAA